MCGKTVTLCKLLANKRFFKPCPPSRVLWVSGSGTVDKNVESFIKQHYPDSQFFYEKPNWLKLRAMIKKYDVVVFDDLAGELANDREFTNFFTKTAHHTGSLIFYLTQNPFENSREAVTRTRNCSYQIFFNNNSDVRWIGHVGNQLLGNARLFEDMLECVMKSKYDCLLCDNRASAKHQTEDGQEEKHYQFIGHAFNPSVDNPTCFLVPHK